MPAHLLTKWLAAALVLFSAGCRAPADVPRETFDFSLHPGPGAAGFSHEADLLASWTEGGALRTFWDSGEAGTFTGVDGLQLVYRVHRASAAKGAVLILPGRTEAIVKFAEVARDLVAQGYSTFALTLRAQGEAQRILSDPDKGYVAWFDDYVSDTHRFVTEVMKPEGLPVLALAHSTGGTVAVLLNDAHPDDLVALATTSPMLEIDLGSYPPPVAATLAAGVCDATDGSGYILGGGGYAREASVDTSTVTHSAARHDWKVSQLDADATLRMGSPTWRWLCQALAGSSLAESVGAYSATPTLLFQEGEDSIVKPGGQTRYCDAAPRCTLVAVDGAKHEVLQETDALRNEVMNDIVAFFDAAVTP